MPWWRPRPYPYNLAEWLGVFLALIGTPSLVYEALGFPGVARSTSTALTFDLVWGAVAVAGWTLLLLGTRAHRRTVAAKAL
jgi:hypothetical protein